MYHQIDSCAVIFLYKTHTEPLTLACTDCKSSRARWFKWSMKEPPIQTSVRGLFLAVSVVKSHAGEMVQGAPGFYFWTMARTYTFYCFDLKCDIFTSQMMIRSTKNVPCRLFWEFSPRWLGCGVARQRQWVIQSAAVFPLSISPENMIFC